MVRRCVWSRNLMNEEALKATGYGLNYHSSISDRGRESPAVQQIWGFSPYPVVLGAFQG